MSAPPNATDAHDEGSGPEARANFLEQEIEKDLAAGKAS